MDPSRSISSFSNILREADSALSAMGSPGPQNAQICIRFRKSESARAVVVGVQTATSESPKVLHFWHFRTFGPEQIRESKSLLFQIQIWHFRHFRTRADSGVQISIVKDCSPTSRRSARQQYVERLLGTVSGLGLIAAAGGI